MLGESCCCKYPYKYNSKICPYHINFAMGKVNQFEYAVNQCVAEGNKGIDSAYCKAIDYLLKEHNFISVSITSSPYQSSA